MQSMKGATMLLGSMNRQMNLPALQRIAMEFERENDVMDQRQEMMDDAIDEATGIEGEEEEGEDIVKEVLDEIGVDLNQAVRLSLAYTELGYTNSGTSWVKHRPIYRRLQSEKPEWRSPLGLGVVVVVVVEEQEEEIRVTMIYRLDSTVFADDCHNNAFSTVFSFGFAKHQGVETNELRIQIYSAWLIPIV